MWDISIYNSENDSFSIQTDNFYNMAIFFGLDVADILALDRNQFSDLDKNNAVR